MNNKDTLWITSRLREGCDAKPFWQPNAGRLSVNVVLLNENPRDLTKTINAVRSIRVGSEARYPKITIISKSDSLKEELIDEISKLDTTTPRIKLMIAVNCSDIGTAYNHINWIQSIARKRFIDTSLLCLSFGGNPPITKILFSHTLSHKIFHEWYPDASACNSEDIFTQYKLAYKELYAAGYDYTSHPLSLCGGISLISREILISKFNNNLKKKYCKNRQQNHEMMQYIGSFDHIVPDCSLGAMAYLFGDQNLATRFSCICTSGQELPQKVTQIFTTRKSESKEHRLFEDWQYIYDGFDYV